MSEPIINPSSDSNLKKQPIPDNDLRGIYTINPVISCREEGTDGAILYNPDIDDFLLINGTGLITWNFLKELHTIAEISDFLLHTFGNTVSKEETISDISVFITELIPDYLLEVVSEQP